MKRFLAVLVLIGACVFASHVSATPGAGMNYLSSANLHWVKGPGGDSTTVSQTFGQADTSFALIVGDVRPLCNAPLSATDSTIIMYGDLSWTNVAGDSMQVTVQYSYDGTNWTTLKIYNVVNSHSPFPLMAWRNAVAAMDLAVKVRAIVLHNDGSSQIVKTFTFGVKFFGKQ